MAVLNRNWILHFKCITDFDALQWALIACTKGGAHVCVLQLYINGLTSDASMNCICAPPLAKQCIELYTGLNIYDGRSSGAATHACTCTLRPRSQASPQLFILYKKKQCWEGVYEQGVAWPSHLRAVARAVSAKHCSCKVISGMNPWASSDYIKLHICRTHFNVLCSLTDW